MEEGHTEAPGKKLDFHPQQVEEGIWMYQEKSFNFGLGIGVYHVHMKTVGMDTNDRDKGVVVDAQPKIVHRGLKAETSDYSEDSSNRRVCDPSNFERSMNVLKSRDQPNIV
jgi:hypothetical protein